MSVPFAPDRHLARAAAVVVLGVGAGMGLRALLSPWIGDSLPFVFAFPALVAVGLHAGPVPTVVATVLCAAWVVAPWLSPSLDADVEGLQLGVFVASGITIAALSQRAWRALPGADTSAPEGGSALRGLEWALLASAVVPTAFFLVVAWTTHEDAIEESQARINAMVRIAAEHGSRVIETNEVITRHLLSLTDDLSDDEILAREASLHADLKRISQGLPQIQSIWILDANGRPLVNDLSLPAPHERDYSDRVYFTHLRDHAEPWYVNERLISRATGEPFFDITRRRETRDGRFNGVISVSLHPDYFARFYAGVADQLPGAVISLYRADGARIARHPILPSTARANAGPVLLSRFRAGDLDGDVRDLSNVDGDVRHTAFRRIGNFPLYVTAGADRDTMLADWYRDMGVLAAITFPAAAGLAYLSWVALRRTRRELAVVEQLRQESEQRSRAEEALRQAQKLEALGQLTGGVAHDFNNLLMVISNNLHLHQKLHPELGHNANLAAISRAVTGGAKLTRQLLAFSRRQALRPEVVALQQLIPAMAELVRTTVGRSVSVTAEVAPDLPAVEVDPAELELALINLAINARDAMPDGGRLALIAARVTAAELPNGLHGDLVAITVSDTGSGVPPEVAERVFEPFFTTKQPGHGTGLGLSQVYGFCAQAGGTARLTSEVGVGTTVAMYLPASTAPLPAPEPERAQPPQGLRANVLLVEDNADVASATMALLASFGCRAAHATSADEALALLDATGASYDVMLSDIVMPGTMNGVALALAVRQHHPRLPIVLMTGYAAEVHRALAAGFEVLPKPCAPDTMLVALRTAMAATSGAPGVAAT